MNKFFAKSWLVSAGLVLALAGCGSGAGSTSTGAGNGAESGADGDKLNIVTTFYPMYEFSRQVAGEHANVTALVPTGTEPHDWEPSAKDMAQIQEADVFVYNGIVETWVEDALASTGNDQRIVIEATSGIDLTESAEAEHEHEAEEHSHEGEEQAHGEEEGHSHDYAQDPHVWLSPVLAQKEVKAIEQALIKADPANQADYEANANAYIAKLQELDTAYRNGLANVKNKELVTQHAAFAYLAHEYGLTQVPISGLSPDQEPSPDQMAEIVQFAKEHGVKTIFFETLVDPKVAQTIAGEIGAKTAVLNPLEGLTEDDIKNNRDYIAVMQENLKALTTALNE
ncbi:metal ABC transporter substrate-binding protein [Paenibacillus sp. P96]|uniref:Metal ABC transporter substrate-binding protein n=1 Tax=Paenibacillus zeirhizosphaerae TaxID=2987519 RepID=A0ABT9FR88_9BACL|nr:metal ABC transporter substrate-binding protein [Paenibacillus sp. P96]MDP4097253.1 metal ABC transporter substrate-binding protein [Paenibacillus sp. P96]